MKLECLSEPVLHSRSPIELPLLIKAANEIDYLRGPPPLSPHPTPHAQTLLTTASRNAGSFAMKLRKLRSSRERGNRPRSPNRNFIGPVAEKASDRHHKYLSTRAN